MKNITRRRFKKFNNHHKKVKETQNDSNHNIRKILVKNENKIIIGSTIICIIFILLITNQFIKLISFGADGNNNNSKDPDEYLAIPYSNIKDGEIHYFETYGVKYYVHYNPWGNIISRISLCELCAGTTFTLVNYGRVVDCDVCNTRWDADQYSGIYPASSETRRGGCEEVPPYYLANEFESGYVMIKKDHLRAFAEN